MESFKIGDRVYAEEGFIYGRIVEIEENFGTCEI